MNWTFSNRESGNGPELRKGDSWSAPFYDAAATLLSIPVRRYLIAQRDRLAHEARKLTRAEESGLSPYFSQVDLDRIRIVVANPLPIPEPPLSALVRRLGFDFPRVSSTAAIVFDHVIAAIEPMSTELLFHEAVHTVQTRVLGLARFARLYITGFECCTRNKAIEPAAILQLCK